MREAAEKLLRENIALQAGEGVVVVSDRDRCGVFEAVCRAVVSLGGKLKMVRINNERGASAPLPGLSETFLQTDVLIGITDKSITHCPETLRAREERGVRVVTMPGVDAELFLKGSKAAIREIREVSEKLMFRMLKSSFVRVVTPAGADFKVKVEKEIHIDDGDSTYAGALSNFPAGEVCMAPVNWAAGLVAIDFSRQGVMPEDGVKLQLSEGKITGCNNEKAGKFVDFLRNTDARALEIVEFAIGTNPEHRELVGKIIHDEKIFGSVHVAFGGWGNKRPCKIHEDVVLLKPSVWFDEEMVISEGKIL